MDNWEPPLRALAAECADRNIGFRFDARNQTGRYMVTVLYPWSGNGPSFERVFDGRTRAEALSKALHDIVTPIPDAEEES